MRRAVATLTLALLAGACGPDGTPQATPMRLAEPATAPAVAHQLLMWSQGGLPADVADRAERLEGVAQAATMWSDTLGLTGSQRADGTPVDDFEEGWRLPVSATAILPADYAPFVRDASTRAVVLALRPGRVLLARAFAEGRGLGVGAFVDLVGRPGLVVAGVVDDGTIGSGEIVLHVDDASSAGITRGASLVVDTLLPPGLERDALAARLADLVADETPARVVDTADPDVGREAALVLTLGQIKATFGEFAYRPRDGHREVDADPTWEMENIVRAQVPILGTVRCHRLIMDDLVAALDEIVAVGLAGAIDPDMYDGCWYPRRISTERHSLSSHSWGIALDINVDLELPGLGPPPDPAVVAIFERHGFRWGGDFLTPDNHHFEWIGGQVTPFPRPT